jgi:hypothetical protein
MKDAAYIERIENAIRQMLTPVRDIPLNLVIESMTGRTVLPFDSNNPTHAKALELLKQVAVGAAQKIRIDGGITRNRPNEVGNAIEPYVRTALAQYKLSPSSPAGKSGKAKSTGYPDLAFNLDGTLFYLECKTYNQNTAATTLRSFYLSPSDDFKVTRDAVHLALSFETLCEGNTYHVTHYKLLSLEHLSLDVKHEFNSDNRRLYSGKHGAITLAEAPC